MYGLHSNKEHVSCTHTYVNMVNMVLITTQFIVMWSTLSTCDDSVCSTCVCDVNKLSCGPQVALVMIVCVVHVYVNKLA